MYTFSERHVTVCHYNVRPWATMRTSYTFNTTMLAGRLLDRNSAKARGEGPFIVFWYPPGGLHRMAKSIGFFLRTTFPNEVNGSFGPLKLRNGWG